jgi:BRCA1/BRCA2-containing complex subunit 3
MSEDLVNAMEDAKHFSRIKGANLNVIGWYHSHPHITVWPSNVGEYLIISNNIYN